MKEAELRKHAICSMCGNKVMASGSPLFWRVTIERLGIKFGPVQRQQGLTMMLGGSAALAAVMGPDEDLASPVMDTVTLTVCEECCTKSTCVAALADYGTLAELKGEG